EIFSHVPGSERQMRRTRSICFAPLSTLASRFILSRRSRDLHNILCLEPFWAFDHVERNAVAFAKSAKTFAHDRGLMNEDIGSAPAHDETVALGVVVPLDSTFFGHNGSLLREH